MKVLRVINSMDPKSGGPCQGIRNSIPAMSQIGVETEVVCFDAKSTFYQDSFKIHAIGPSVGPYAYCKDLESWLKQNLDKFEVVIIHGLWLYHTYGTYRVWKKLKNAGEKVPRLYVMPHGMLDPYFQKAKERRLKALRNDIFWFFIEKKVVNNVDGVLFTCEEELLLAKQTFKGYAPKKELNAGYGIQKPPIISPDMRNELLVLLKGWNEKPFFLFLSRIHPKKGVEMLIQAYLRLEQEYPELPQLVVAGPGLESDYGINIQQQSKKSNNILFPGMLQGQAKWGAFYESQIFVLPSHQENFGIAVVEALACGTPVLISNKVNIWREIESVDGGIVESDTFEGTYDMLKKWMCLSEMDQDVYQKGALRAYREFYKIDQAAKKFLSVIE